MSAQPRCQAQDPAHCTDPNCPEKKAQHAAFLADFQQHIGQVSRPQPTHPETHTRITSGAGAGHAIGDEGNYTRRNCMRIAAEMEEHETHHSYMHKVMLNAQTTPGYLLATAWDEHGPSGYLEYHIDKSPIMPEVVVHNIRSRQTHQDDGTTRDSKGAGAALLRHAAQVAIAQKNPETVLVIQGAVASARPFYAKMGGQTSATNSLVHFTREATEALAAGTPIRLEHIED